MKNGENFFKGMLKGILFVAFIVSLWSCGSVSPHQSNPGHSSEKSSFDSGSHLGKSKSEITKFNRQEALSYVGDLLLESKEIASTLSLEESRVHFPKHPEWAKQNLYRIIARPQARMLQAIALDQSKSGKGKDAVETAKKIVSGTEEVAKNLEEFLLPSVLLPIGEALLKEGRKTEAKKVADLIPIPNSGNGVRRVAGLAYQASVYMRIGDETGQKKMQDALRIANGNYLPLAHVANWQEKAGNGEESHATFRTAIKAVPKTWQTQKRAKALLQIAQVMSESHDNVVNVDRQKKIIAALRMSKFGNPLEKFYWEKNVLAEFGDEKGINEIVNDLKKEFHNFGKEQKPGALRFLAKREIEKGNFQEAKKLLEEALLLVDTFGNSGKRITRLISLVPDAARTKDPILTEKYVAFIKDEKWMPKGMGRVLDTLLEKPYGSDAAQIIEKLGPVAKKIQARWFLDLDNVSLGTLSAVRVAAGDLEDSLMTIRQISNDTIQKSAYMKLAEVLGWRGNWESVHKILADREDVVLGRLAEFNRKIVKEEAKVGRVESAVGFARKQRTAYARVWGLVGAAQGILDRQDILKLKPSP